MEDPPYSTKTEGIYNYGSTAQPASLHNSVPGSPASYVQRDPYAAGGFPTQQTVQSTRIVGLSPFFDFRYFMTVSGILKVIELIFTFIAFVISVATWSSHTFYIYASDGSRRPLYYPYAYGSSVWTDIVTSIAFLVTLTLLLLYLFHIIEKYYQVQWLLVECLYCLAVAFCLLIAGAVMIPAYGDPSRGAVVFFCWAAMVVYFVDAFLKFRAYRAGETAQGI